MDWYVAITIALALLAIWASRPFWSRSQTIREYERGLHFRKGRLVRELDAGRYRIHPRIDEVTVVDARRRQAVVSGQEVLTSDRVPIKISLIAEFTVADVSKAVLSVADFEDTLYGKIQLALREAVAGLELDAALAERGELGRKVAALVQPGASDFGVEVHSVQVRDFMMGGGLRNAFADVIEAKQQGLAALERARGESAAVRNLANAASLMEKHPGIMQLRLLQAVESGTGNRIVIALDPDRGRSTEIEVAAQEDG